MKRYDTMFQKKLNAKPFFQFILPVLIPTFLFLSIPYANAQEILQKNACTFPSAGLPVETRLHNIDLMRNVLKKGEYSGYDVIIISSTTKRKPITSSRFSKRHSQKPPIRMGGCRSSSRLLTQPRVVK